MRKIGDMKVIFEAPDRCGKDTQIGLLQNFAWRSFAETFEVVHYSNNKYLSNEESRTYSYKLYSNMLENLRQKRNVIFNRSHIGEYVYSPLYRNYDGSYVFNLEISNQIHFQDDIYLIVLYDNAETLLDRDDGKSFSTSLEMKQKEIDSFKEAYKRSVIQNKILINCFTLTEFQVHRKIVDFLSI